MPMPIFKRGGENFISKAKNKEGNLKGKHWINRTCMQTKQMHEKEQINQNEQIWLSTVEDK